MSKQEVSITALAELAAQTIVDEQGYDQEVGESALEAFGWAMDAISYGSALAMFARAVIDIDRAQRA